LNEKRDNFVGLDLMKFSLSLMLLAGFLLASCSEMDEPPQRARQRTARYPEQGTAQTPPGQQPFNPNAAPSPENTAPAPENAPPTASTPAAKVAKGDYPYGIPVPGKPHVVESPFSPGKFIDVEGFPPGTEVKDPYTGKIFRVP
jgi:hypothetical protein